MFKYYLLTSKREQNLPDRMFKSDDFPDPEGPMMAVNFPDSNFPEMHFKIVLKPRWNNPDLILICMSDCVSLCVYQA